jgi:hypothetical protein
MPLQGSENEAEKKTDEAALPLEAINIASGHDLHG